MACSNFDGFFVVLAFVYSAAQHISWYQYFLYTVRFGNHAKLTHIWFLVNG